MREKPMGSRVETLLRNRKPRLMFPIFESSPSSSSNLTHFPLSSFPPSQQVPSSFRFGLTFSALACRSFPALPLSPSFPHELNIESFEVKRQRMKKPRRPLSSSSRLTERLLAGRPRQSLSPFLNRERAFLYLPTSSSSSSSPSSTSDCKIALGVADLERERGGDRSWFPNTNPPD